MEPTGELPRSGARADVPAAAELVVLNGRLSGTRRPLTFPLTVVGRAAGCDVRLNVDGVEPHHCLLAFGPAGLTLRDLGGAAGTAVNGEKVSCAPLADGDELGVGPFQFRLRLSPGPGAASQAGDPALRAQKDALHVQAAAVAAQQAALDEQEVQLNQRRAALEQQEEQLAAHLEEKRRQADEAQEKIRTERETLEAEREALDAERTAYARHVQKVSAGLARDQKELDEARGKVRAERERLQRLTGRLRQRWQCHWAGERLRLERREEELADEAANLRREAEGLRRAREDFDAERLHFNGRYELGRRQLRDAWDRLRQAQRTWRQRRGKERAALRLRAQELEQAERSLADLREALRSDREAWEGRRQGLAAEVAGLETRAGNQRQKIHEQAAELLRLEGLLRERQLQALSPVQDIANAGPADLPPVGAPPAPAADGQAPPLPSEEGLLRGRMRELEKLAGELADQRRHLVEQWQRLAATQRRWERDRAEAAAELDALAARVVRQEKALAERERAAEQAEAGLRQGQDELVKLRQGLVGWRARLRAREAAWEGERDQLVLELRHRDEHAAGHLQALVALRQGWARRRRQDLDQLRAERNACEQLRREYLGLREEWARRAGALDEEKRVLTERALALEEFRTESLARADDAVAARRKVERLRRRWLAQNAAALRAVAREREALGRELAMLEDRSAELQRRGEAVTAAAAELAERMTAWEHKQALAAGRQARLQQEVQTAQAQRANAEGVLARLREEIEDVARHLLDEPHPPALPLGKAA